MNRRSFVQHSAMGALVTSVHASVLLPSLSLQDDWQQWLTSVQHACHIRPLSFLSGFDAAQREAIASTFEKPGLTAFDKKRPAYFVYPGHFFAVIPQQHSRTGLLDLAIPFWAQQPDGNWVQFATFSIFMLEAWAHACNSDAFPPAEKADYLLPIGTGATTIPQTAAAFLTKKGSVSFKTKLSSKNGITTHIKVSGAQDIYWESTIYSKHYLSSGQHSVLPV